MDAVLTVVAQASITLLGLLVIAVIFAFNSVSSRLNRVTSISPITFTSSSKSRIKQIDSVFSFHHWTMGAGLYSCWYFIYIFWASMSLLIAHKKQMLVMAILFGLSVLILGICLPLELKAQFELNKWDWRGARSLLSKRSLFLSVPFLFFLGFGVYSMIAGHSSVSDLKQSMSLFFVMLLIFAAMKVVMLMVLTIEIEIEGTIEISISDLDDNIEHLKEQLALMDSLKNSDSGYRESDEKDN